MDPTTAIMGSIAPVSKLTTKQGQNSEPISAQKTDLTWEENARRGGKWSKPHQKNGDMVYIYILQDSSTEKGFAMILWTWHVQAPQA